MVESGECGMTREEAKEVLGDVRAYLACRAILENEILAGHTFTDICNAIKTLEQEPKIGHWIRVDKNKLRCSACEVIHLIAQYPNGKIAWCPNCGAKMVEAHESEV